MSEDPNFWPDPDRAIYINGTIDDSMCSRLIREINLLRSVTDRPITAYINSHGGHIRVIEVLMGLLKCQDQHGVEPRLINVVSGDAASAAAMLLAMGDYAIAYPHSIVHYHGVRYGEIVDLTTEKASISAKSLAARNREIALTVANATIKRLAHRYMLVSGEFSEIKENPDYKDASEIECFLLAIADKLGDAAYAAACDSIRKTIKIPEIINNAFANIDVAEDINEDDKQLEIESQILRGILDYEIKNLSQGTIDENAMEQLTSDYLLIRDYCIGDHAKSLSWISQNFGLFFLHKDDAEEYQQNISQKSEAEILAWVEEKIGDRVRTFWYFNVLLCRRLHEGENRLSAEDAYWLGLVDEVLGTPLTGYRNFLKNQAQITEPVIPGMADPG